MSIDERKKEIPVKLIILGIVALYILVIVLGLMAGTWIIASVLKWIMDGGLMFTFVANNNLLIIICILYIQGCLLVDIFLGGSSRVFMPRDQYDQYHSMSKCKAFIHCLKWPWLMIKYCFLSMKEYLGNFKI